MDAFEIEKTMVKHITMSRMELYHLYRHLLAKKLIIAEHDAEYFSNIGHSIRVQLPCGKMKVSLSRARALMESDREKVPWEIALVDPKTDSVIVHEALHPDEDAVDPMISVLGDLNDYQTIENELIRLNRYFENSN